jgi:5-methyltetrahydrofolate--homocysteine methyltransferase
LEIIREINAYAGIPLMAKPNAGLPIIENGHTVFPMDAAAFNAFTPAFREAGVSLLGGCCGTTPAHIQGMAERLHGLTPLAVPKQEGLLLLSSPRRTVVVSPTPQAPIRVIGERINPTGKAGLQAELKAGRLEMVKTLAAEQKNAGADILDVNMGMPGIDESQLMVQAVEELAVVSDLPLCIDSSHPEVIAAAVRFYPGRVLVNSLSGEAHKLESLLPIIKHYGPAFIVLPVDDAGVPESPDERLAVLKKILEACRVQGVSLRQAVVDGIVLTVSTQPENARSTLKTIHYVAGELGLNTVIGLSNVSFGLPGREHVNSAFLSMAAVEGLSMVIANPTAPQLMDAKRAADLLVGRDPAGRQFIEAWTARNQPGSNRPKPREAKSLEERIQEAVLSGEKDSIQGLLQAALDQGLPAFELVQKLMIPAIQTVGEKYDHREYFLPQLIAGAEAMERGVQFLAPRLSQENRTPKAVGVLATVKGDVHDIGKKIVSLILRNNGYHILDLGKSVDAEVIVEQARAAQADFIGLSALMTTTMSEMKSVIQMARKQGYAGKIILGGAVVTPAFAAEAGADGYAPDANKAVELLGKYDLISLG